MKDKKKVIKGLKIYLTSTFHHIVKYSFFLILIMLFFVSVILIARSYRNNYKKISKNKLAGNSFFREKVCSDPKKRLEYEKNGYINCEKAENDKEKDLHWESILSLLEESILGDIFKGVIYLYNSLKVLLVSSFSAMNNVWTIIGFLAAFVFRIGSVYKIINLVKKRFG